MPPPDTPDLPEAIADDLPDTSSGSGSVGAPTGASTTGAGRRWSTLTAVSIALVVGGVLAMVVPGLLRDGVCGLMSCADVTPEVGVGRPTGTALGVVVPEGAAGELQSLRLFPLTGQQQQESAGEWILYRTGEEAPTTIRFGEEPDGFDTRIPLDDPPTEGLWVLEASFGCSSTLVRFSPTELDPGFVTAGGAPRTVDAFLDGARSSVRCATEAPGWQRLLFFLGLAATSVGAVLGIVVVFRKPASEDPDWYVP